jgi:hypothetical protein
MARGTNIKWIQTAGGWTSAKMLLDVYGHYLPTESAGFADALTGPPRSADGTHTAPGRSRAAATKPPRIARAWSSSEKMESTIRVERTTCAPLRGSTRSEARARFAPLERRRAPAPIGTEALLITWSRRSESNGRPAHYEISMTMRNNADLRSRPGTGRQGAAGGGTQDGTGDAKRHPDGALVHESKFGNSSAATVVLVRHQSRGILAFQDPSSD